jgi:hypothetical protein
MTSHGTEVKIMKKFTNNLKRFKYRVRVQVIDEETGMMSKEETTITDTITLMKYRAGLYARWGRQQLQKLLEKSKYGTKSNEH